ncbi:hypothetical protein NBO_1299g0001 [Nosema bombycis CQ1]|uniref:Uncharacterized protein n=1 Tax=Nosema bombycis (strain CQ1 / CVCC 102059) TaxID=578461 RepID=R0KME0_NOSB1|nr:hypothetical protein NBO_1299g0001 [Nosema bombycis CQ1]|eukprot:EOB11307.1 hypothetical protein NBO_1299g0001 [Nosema bombycis CQ1]
MTRNNFEERIMKKYQNRLLTNGEIESICDQAVEEGILQREDIKNISNCDTIELLLNINKWKSAYLFDALKLDESSESEYETIKEEFKDPNRFNKYSENNFSPNKSIFYTPTKHTEGSFLSQIYNTPVKSREPENPFMSPFGRRVPKDPMEFESFCEDLKEKTKSIKKTVDDRTAETVKKLIDDFIKYSELKKDVKREVKKSNCGWCFIYLIGLVALLYTLYIPKPI